VGSALNGDAPLRFTVSRQNLVGLLGVRVQAAWAENRLAAELVVVFVVVFVFGIGTGEFFPVVFVFPGNGTALGNVSLSTQQEIFNGNAR